MYSRSNFNALWIKARDITIDKIRREKFTDKLQRIKTSVLLANEIDGDKYTSIDNSIAVFDLLMESWGCDKKKFLGELFAVLGKVLPKHNSFSLIGESNSGKSLLMRSLIPVFDNIIGEVHQSCANQFSFQDCVAKNLIFAEEFVIGEELQDQIKLQMEGSCCKVAVKCKADGYVD
jgi:hypothetical protein